MRLAFARLIDVGPFGDVTFPFVDDTGASRPITVVYGSGGVGKTLLLAALTATRPGHCVLPSAVLPGLGTLEGAPLVVCDWQLGSDDPDRPHPLRLTSPTPGARGFDHEDAELLRRREQALFDRRAREGGFAFLALPATRWFSRQPVALHGPLRSIARYDVRAPVAFDDGARADLTRDVKAALAYAEINRALVARAAVEGRAGVSLGEAMHECVNRIARLAGFAYSGVDATSFEPMFLPLGVGRGRRFDELPTAVRHLVSFVALSARTLWSARPDTDPREAEGLVFIDDIDLGLEPGLAAQALGELANSLRGVQWIVTTSSSALSHAVEPEAVIALRRAPDESVELHLGSAALTH